MLNDGELRLGAQIEREPHGLSFCDHSQRDTSRIISVGLIAVVQIGIELRLRVVPGQYDQRTEVGNCRAFVLMQSGESEPYNSTHGVKLLTVADRLE